MAWRRLSTLLIFPSRCRRSSEVNEDVDNIMEWESTRSMDHMYPRSVLNDLRLIDTISLETSMGGFPSFHRSKPCMQW
jgi:hypothetical protein